MKTVKILMTKGFSKKAAQKETARVELEAREAKRNLFPNCPQGITSFIEQEEIPTRYW